MLTFWFVDILDKIIALCFFTDEFIQMSLSQIFFTYDHLQTSYHKRIFTIVPFTVDFLHNDL